MIYGQTTYPSFPPSFRFQGNAPYTPPNLMYPPRNTAFPPSFQNTWQAPTVYRFPSNLSFNPYNPYQAPPRPAYPSPMPTNQPVQGIAVGEPNPSAPSGLQLPVQNTGDISTSYLKSLMANLDLTEQQSDAVQACFIRAGLNSMVKATRDDDPNGWLMNKMTETIQVDPRTGNFTFNWANGNKMTITQAQINQVRATEYKGKPVSDLVLATETAWFQAHPDQKKTGGYSHDFYKEMFGLDSGYMPISTSALNTAKQKGVVSTVSAHSNLNTFHAWSLDYEGSTWDLNNSDIKGGFRNLPQTRGMKNVDLNDAQLAQAVLSDKNAYISYFKIPA
ncbi:MAG: hypothetical protein LW809_02270 [Vampirovibrionales bacterium]|nr:hypothetical protein [Vampirovibrionales bacterium]